MKATVAELRKVVDERKAEAAKAHGLLEEARKPLASDDFDLTTDQGRKAFDGATAVSNEYGKALEALDGAKSDLISLLEMEGKSIDVDLKGKTPFSFDGKSAELVEALSSMTPGSRVTESAGYKALLESGLLNSEQSRIHMEPAKALTRDEHIWMVKNGLAGMEMKTLATSVGDPGSQLLRPVRLPGYLPILQAALQLRNLISVGATDGNAVEWVKMTGITNNAAEVAEATATSGSSGSKPESGFEFDIESSKVQTIAHYIPATRAALQDMAQLQTIIDSLLIDGVNRRLNTQILQGDGTNPNLRGILNTVGIQAQDDTVLGNAGAKKIERVLAAITKIRLAFMEPSAVLMHPLDFEAVRLAKTDLGYLFGPPSQVGETRIWGLPIVQDTSCPEGSPVVADWSQAVLYVRDEVNILATDSHSDWFTRNLIAILAEGRYALTVPRPDAFCTVDFTTVES